MLDSLDSPIWTTYDLIVAGMVGAATVTTAILTRIVWFPFRRKGEQEWSQGS